MTDSTVLDDCKLTPYGYVVEANDEYIIEVTRMMFNWRIVLSRTEMHGLTYESGYCYFGLDAEVLARTLLAAKAWTDPFNTEPIGYDKKAF